MEEMIADCQAARKRRDELHFGRIRQPTQEDLNVADRSKQLRVGLTTFANPKDQQAKPSPEDLKIETTNVCIVQPDEPNSECPLATEAKHSRRNHIIPIPDRNQPSSAHSHIEPVDDDTWVAALLTGLSQEKADSPLNNAGSPHPSPTLLPQHMKGGCRVLSLSPTPPPQAADRAGKSTATGIVISDSPVSFRNCPWIQDIDIPRYSAEWHGHPDFLYTKSVLVNPTVQAHVCDPTAILLPRDIPLSLLQPFQKMGHIKAPTDDYTLYAKDLACLDNDELLNDEVVNAYISLLAIRSHLDPSLPRTVAASTHFYAHLRSDRFHLTHKIYKWMRRIKVPSAEFFVIPINFPPNIHWSLVFVDFPKNSVTMYNSMPDKDTTIPGQIADILNAFFARHSSLPPRKWHIQTIAEPAIPPQKDSVSCGLFACCAADCLTAGRYPDGYCKQCMPSMRKEWRQFLSRCRPAQLQLRFE